MARFAVWLSTRLGRTAIDRTDLDGIFDLDLRWESDQPAALIDVVPANTVASRKNLTFRFSPAAQEQLGLTVESTKTAMEIFIDHVERPSAN